MSGMVITGGGSNLKNLDEAIKVRTKISNVKITDGIEYIVKRFEEMAVELAEEKKEKKKYKDRVEQLEGVKKYTLPDVPVSHAAEAQVELEK